MEKKVDWTVKQVFEDLAKEDAETDRQLDAVFGTVQSIIRKYMDMSEENLHLVSLWVIGTYMYNEFETFPLLFINATKGSGKTRLLKLLEALCANGKIQANLSEAVLFRVKKKHTILIDEFEQVGNKEKGTIRELINASYKRGARVERMKEVYKEGKKDYAVESFDLYSPVAMANIWGMDDVVEDRCIIIRLDRSEDMLRSKMMEDFDDNEEIHTFKRLISSQLCRLCMYVGLKKAKPTWNLYLSSKYNPSHPTLLTPHTLPTLPTLEERERDERLHSILERIDNLGVYGRSLELLFPLIIISNRFGDEVFERTLEISKRIFNERNTEEFTENPDVALLDFLWKTYADKGALEYIPIIQLTNNFNVANPSFAAFSTEQVGRALKRLNVILDKRRDFQGVKIMIDLAKTKEKLERYKGVINGDMQKV